MSIACKTQEVNVLLYLAPVRPQLEYCLRFWAPHFQDVEKLERVQKHGRKMKKGSSVAMLLGNQDTGTMVTSGCHHTAKTIMHLLAAAVLFSKEAPGVVAPVTPP